jgi:hypothetical protein
MLLVVGVRNIFPHYMLHPLQEVKNITAEKFCGNNPHTFAKKNEVKFIWISERKKPPIFTANHRLIDRLII